MVHVVQNKTFPSNTYLLSDLEYNTCLIIDPGLDEELIEAKIRELEYEPIGIIVTHGHFDHIGSVAYFQKKYGIPYYLHEKDLKISKSANFFLKFANVEKKIDTPHPDSLIKGEVANIEIGNFSLNVYNYPGHSEGSIIIKYGTILFTGDLFYRNGLGFNGFPGENKALLKQSINDIFNNFDDNSTIYPGHGKHDSLKYIKNNNSELIEYLKSNTE